MKALKQGQTDGHFDQTDLDKIFADQRLTGTNPIMIRRVKSVDYIEQA